jgi:hypothetical protein
MPPQPILEELGGHGKRFVFGFGCYELQNGTAWKKRRSGPDEEGLRFYLVKQCRERLGGLLKYYGRAA